MQQKLRALDKPPVSYKHLLSGSSTLVRFSELKKGTEQEKNVNESETEWREEEHPGEGRAEGQGSRRKGCVNHGTGQRPRPSGRLQPLSTNEPDVCILAGHREPQQ